jgi:hypothetical protein
MPIQNDNNYATSSNPSGWAMAGAVVVLMASLVYFTNGRSVPQGYEQHAAVHFTAAQTSLNTVR